MSSLRMLGLAVPLVGQLGQTGLGDGGLRWAGEMKVVLPSRLPNTELEAAAMVPGWKAARTENKCG